MATGHHGRIVAIMLACGALIAGIAGAAETRPPNVIFILADDLGYTDLACYGSRYYQTPNIDRLASQGMRFLNHHHCPNCAPTRAALLTGQYGPRTGVYTVGSIKRFDTSARPLQPVENVTDLPLDRTLIAGALKQADYTTGMFGKWHLGNQADYHPAQRGFDEALVVSTSDHFRFKTQPPTEIPAGQYMADFLTDKAVDFIQRHERHPFFLYLPHFGVHSPIQAKEDLIARFQDKPTVGGHHNPTYAAMIASIDESVGRILATLDELKLSEETIVIFASDNGGVGGYRREGIKRGAEDTTDNAPLRSGKGSLYEGGTRVPLIVRWPDKILSGTTCDVPTIHVDLFPTLLEVAGGQAPKQVLDGESLVALWKTPGARLQRTAIYQHFPGYLGAGKKFWRTTPVSLIQEGDWKLMEFFEDGRLELYNLRTDVGETKNLASQEPGTANALHAKLVQWREQLQAPIPARK